MPKVTHRPKGRMCQSCRYLHFVNCPDESEFKDMQPIGKDDDGVIVVRCTQFERLGKSEKNE